MPNGFLGYNFGGPSRGGFVPQRLQNLCIRDHAARHGLVLSFSVSEYFDAAPALMLFSQFEHIGALDGLIFFSLALLPGDRKRRAAFYARMTDSGKELHFALEDLVWTPGRPWKDIDRLYRLRFDSRPDDNRRALQKLVAKPPGPA